jgi:hypothetical protein
MAYLDHDFLPVIPKKEERSPRHSSANRPDLVSSIVTPPPTVANVGHELSRLGSPAEQINGPRSGPLLQ